MWFGRFDSTFNLQVYHPNIDLEGNVCLNILREDWKPVLNINTIIYGLFHLFTVLFLLSPVTPWLFGGFLVFTVSVCACSNPITKIRSIMMLLLCWGITQRCLNRMWEGRWLVGMWGRPSSHGACSSCLHFQAPNSGWKAKGPVNLVSGILPSAQLWFFTTMQVALDYVCTLV